MTNETIEATIISLTKESAITSRIVSDIHTRLFGNGQPGELDKMSTLIDQSIKAVDTRLKRQESFSNKIRGALAIVLTVIGVMGAEIMHLLGKI